MKLSLIVAMAQNRTIGVDNKLPWHLPEDLKYFRRITMGKPIIMGRKTHESIGKALPGRTNIVVTRQQGLKFEGCEIVSNLDDAIGLAEQIGLINGMDEAVVIGGAELYALALPLTDRIYLTEVQAEVQGDAFFPEVDWSEWQEMVREDFKAKGPNPYDYSFLVLDRIEDEA